MVSHSRECPVCYGQGVVPADEAPAPGSGMMARYEECSGCGGDGEVEISLD